MSAYAAHLKAVGRAARTQRNVIVALGELIKFAGPARPLTELSQDLLVNFYGWLREPTGRHGEPRSLDTSAKYVSIVQRWWLWCSRHDAFAHYAPSPRVLEGLPRDPQSPVDAATWEEMDCCIAAAGGTYPIALFAMRVLGLRVSQVMGLRVGDLDLARGLLRFRGELGKSKQERRGRVVPVSPAALPVLRALCDGRAATDWLVPSRRAKGLREREVRTEYVCDAWQRAGVRAEVWRKRPDHAFRKGFVSGLRRLGADPDAVEVLVGHSLGLRSVYTADGAHPLEDAVARVPPLSAAAHERVMQAIEENQ